MSDFGLTPARRRLFLVLLGLVAYAPVLKVPFIWDDHTMIETNPRIRAWRWAAIHHDFTSDVFEGHGDAYYRPAQTESDRIDYSIWRLHPFGYHLTNLLAHIANALLLEALLILMGLPLLTAFICASLFVVSPIGVEQLIIVAGRAELLGLTFGLLSLVFLAKRSSWKNALAAYAFFAVALLFKESAVVTPVLGALVL